jgi:exodeoxyribonuclease-3
MKFLSLNCNGIRSAFSKGLPDYLLKNQFDIISFQEVKALEKEIDMDFFKSQKYIPYLHPAEKKGYSGTAIFTKILPESSSVGMNLPEYDREGRLIRLDFPKFTLINCYFPSGTSGEERQSFKIRFLDDIQKYLQKIQKKQKKIVLCGDVNIAHQEIDIHDPKGNAKNSGFLPEERKWVTQFLESGWIDSFRFQNPTLKDTYSWWTFRFGARSKNKGWRIDYFFLTEECKPFLINAGIHTDVVVSDHAPIYLEMKF